MTQSRLKRTLFAGLAVLTLTGGAMVAATDTAEAQGRRGGWHGGGFKGGWGGHRGGFGGHRAHWGGHRGFHRAAHLGGHRGFHRAAYWGGERGYRHAYWGGYRPYYRRHRGAAVAAGLFGGLALGALAASSYPYHGGYYPSYSYGYAPIGYGGYYGYGSCYWVSPGVQVCD
jgi:hypothetical protein